MSPPPRLPLAPHSGAARVVTTWQRQQLSIPGLPSAASRGQQVLDPSDGCANWLASLRLCTLHMCSSQGRALRSAALCHDQVAATTHPLLSLLQAAWACTRRRRSRVCAPPSPSWTSPASAWRRCSGEAPGVAEFLTCCIPFRKRSRPRAGPVLHWPGGAAQ